MNVDRLEPAAIDNWTDWPDEADLHEQILSLVLHSKTHITG